MKRFFPVLFAVLLVVFSTVPALAADFEFTPDDLPGLGGPYKYILVTRSDNGEYDALATTQPLVVQITDLNKVGLYTPSDGITKFNHYTTVDGVWKLTSNSPSGNQDPNTFVGWYHCDEWDIDIVWVNYDIIDISSGPPSPILPGRLEGVKMTEVLMEIVSILPIVLVCLVGWIALRKGLALLVQLLRKA